MYLNDQAEHHLVIFYITALRTQKYYTSSIYSVIQKDWLKFVRLYFLNYTRYVNDLYNIWKRRS